MTLLRRPPEVLSGTVSFNLTSFVSSGEYSSISDNCS